MTAALYLLSIAYEEDIFNLFIAKYLIRHFSWEFEREHLSNRLRLEIWKNCWNYSSKHLLQKNNKKNRKHLSTFPAELHEPTHVTCWPTLSLRASSPIWGYREKYTRERHARGDATAGGGEEKGELATISHKISFPPRKPRDIVKRENCHHRHAAN